ncbi:hypothetical protein F2Q69_00034892 [Brassica cretica]|uniref:Uncharacterized protein n=1 Tax=Brassica cretica TaxID=69181 RepID=A0A8S9SMP5_BRACR|nr:hypothetical protein F2Q69_00034892 [Brassica cretica]
MWATISSEHNDVIRVVNLELGQTGLNWVNIHPAPSTCSSVRVKYSGLVSSPSLPAPGLSFKTFLADDAARSVTSSSLQWPQLSSSSVTVDLSHASSSS